MPDNYKRGGQRRDPYFNQQPGRRRSFDNRKPPRGGSWQAGVPPWEKTFCKVVGSLDWNTFLDMKRFVHLFEEVVSWDDSAAEEAFHNAKNRFFAQMQGLPCDIPVPDPDMYIDEIDWHAQVDPELVKDLESPHVSTDTGANDDPVIIFGDVLLQQKGYSPPGWGVIEEGKKDTPNYGIEWPAVKPTGWGEEFTDDPWEQAKSGVPVEATGWGDGFNDDTWGEGLPKSGEPVTATGWGAGFEDDAWEKGVPKSGEPVTATGWGEDFDDGRAEWPTLQENWSSSHPQNQGSWRGDKYGAWKNKRNKGARFHGDGIGQSKAACF